MIYMYTRSAYVLSFLFLFRRFVRGDPLFLAPDLVLRTVLFSQDLSQILSAATTNYDASGAVVIWDLNCTSRILEEPPLDTKMGAPDGGSRPTKICFTDLDGTLAHSENTMHKLGTVSYTYPESDVR